MTILTNNFALPSGAAVGDAITAANSVAGGTAFTVLPSITGGSYNYRSGGGEIRLGSTSGYFRLDTAEGGTRLVMRRPFWLQAAPTATTTIMQMRDGSDTLVGNVVLMTNRALRCGPGATIVAASESSVLAINTQYFVEFAVTAGTTTSNGRVEMRITDTDNVQYGDAYDSGAVVNTGTAAPAHCRFGGFSAMTGWTLDRFDGPVRIGPLAAGQWIGPVTGTPAAIPPVVNAGSDTSVSQGATVSLSGTATDSDGTITSTVWSVTSFPGGSTSPTITNSTSLTTASFTASATGTYVLRLTATDNGSNTAYDERTITVTAASTSSSGDRVWTGSVWK
jgi:hypothetical protein